MKQEQTQESIVIEGKNVEEALQAACDRLDTTPNQVEYEIVEESNKGGMLGFLKGRTVKIRVRQKSAAQRMIAEIARELFEKMGVEVETRVRWGEDAYEVEVETDDSDGLLIGRGGDTLKALQHILSRMVGHRDEEARVRVDVAGYRKRRHEALRRKARDLADRALSQGRAAMTEPLPADERRIIHLALADHGEVETRAVGDGQTKRVAVTPTNARRGRGGERERGPRGERGARGGRPRGPSRGRAPRGRRPTDAPDRQPAARERVVEPEEQGLDPDVQTRRHRVGQRDRKRRLRDRPEEEGTRREAADHAPREGENGGRSSETNGEREDVAASPSANATDSYFNIPDTVAQPAEKEGDGYGAGSDQPLTWGRKRRPGRGRR